MLVAGSVLALLLMGLAVDGVLSPAEEDPGNDGSTDDDDDPNDDVSGDPGAGLAELLFGAEQDMEEPSDDVIPTPEELEALHAPADMDPLDAEAVPATSSEDGFVEIEDMTLLADGEDVHYVEDFQTGTDRLVLEFDGLASEAPDIGIDFDSEEGAAVILANGYPVTLVEGATDMTPDQIDIVMLDDIGADAEELLTAEALETSEPDAADDSRYDTGVFDTLSTLSDAAPELPLDTLVFEIPEDDGAKSGETRADDDDRYDTGFFTALETAPETQEQAAVPPAAEALVPAVGGLTDLLDDTVEPLVDVADEITDDLPGLAELNALLDGIGDGLVGDGLGDSSDMLDARVDIDAAFGTGGEDAITGTFVDDTLTGTDGQDALFGDDGDDVLDGGAGNDELHGDFGDDTLSGGEGVDYLNGGEGHDSLDGGADRDVLFGGDGDDTLNGGSGDDVLQGGRGADLLDGGSGNDVLDGTFGRGGVDIDEVDTLIGGDGDDTILFGAGDIAMGGAGADTFVGDAAAVSIDAGTMVTDFDPAEDVIEIVYDPVEGESPTVTVEDFMDGSGANIMLNGDVILSVSGAQGLDPNNVLLRAVG